MSELKYYKLFHRTSSLTSPEFISVVEFGTGEEVCLKSEADKVIAEKDKEIAEKDEEIAELKTKLASARQVLRLNKPEALYSNLETMSRLNRKIYDVERRERHQKYKRCLAMAKWCESEAYIHELGSEYDENLIAWFGKWYTCWLELAEKFKDKETK